MVAHVCQFMFSQLTWKLHGLTGIHSFWGGSHMLMFVRLASRR